MFQYKLTYSIMTTEQTSKNIFTYNNFQSYNNHTIPCQVISRNLMMFLEDIMIEN